MAEKTEEAFGMDNVPFFKQPMAAGPNDPVIGFTESGQPIKKTFNDQTYSVSVDPDQRTTRTKIEEDFIPAMQEWMSDPSLPSKEQTVDFAKGMVKEAAESAEGAVTSTGTYGDVFGLAGAGAVASTAGEVPEGALRIFGGSRAKKFDEDKMVQAADMSQKGVDPAIIWEETGMQFNPDTRKFQFEIDSKGMEFAAPFEEVKSNAMSALEEFDKAEAPLSNIVKFDELYENYPRFKETKIVIDPETESRGTFSSKKNELNLGANYLRHASEEDIRSTILHELQHGVQAHELTPGGNNPKFLIHYDEEVGRFKAEDPELKSWAEELNIIEDELDKLYQNPDNINIKTGELNDKAKITKEILGENSRYLQKRAQEIAYKRYLSDEGEIEGRAAALRDAMTSKEKRETPPSETKRQAQNRELDKYKGAPELPVSPMEHPDEQGFAEGGQVTDGFKDDGQEVETRTGNEIPPGSLDQEVEDSVDAKLSEGEYVLPADVVRFIGLGQIEAMVQQAKQGLQQMEANGRIGGEPVDESGRPVEDEELTPEEMAMLEEAMASEEMGMAEGGSVEFTKYKQKETDNLEKTGMEKGGLVKKCPPNKRKKPVKKKKKKYGLGTRP